MSVWVYSDPHFGHAAIMGHAKRPWVSVDKMDNDLVKLYNSVVKPLDTTYWLGDVTLRAPDKVHWLRRIVNKMHGTKHLIFGNHDDWHWQRYIDAGFASCHTYLETKYLGRDVSLCHDPAWAQDNTKLWVCGHLHNCAFTAPTHIAIACVELTEYKPVELSRIVEGYRPGEGVLRTEPRPNREPREWRGDHERVD